MVGQLDSSMPDYCYILARFDQSIQPEYTDNNGIDTWTFTYQNGMRSFYHLQPKQK